MEKNAGGIRDLDENAGGIPGLKNPDRPLMKEYQLDLVERAVNRNQVNNYSLTEKQKRKIFMLLFFIDARRL